MMFPATGRAFTKVSCDTTVTPLFTRWLTYVTLFIFVFLLMTTVLYTFVTFVTFTVVLVMFTLFTYVRLTRYPGT